MAAKAPGKKVNVNVMDFKNDPKRVLSDIYKDFASSCNEREVK